MKIQLSISHFEVGGRGAMSHQKGHPLKAGKGKKMASTLSPRKEHGPETPQFQPSEI